MSDSQHLQDLQARFRSGERIKLLHFWGHQPGKHGVTAACFSQWYAAPFVAEGVHYPTAEHFMMAEKAALFGDEAARLEILAAPSPSAAKSLGRRVKGFDDVGWLAARFDIVLRANLAKFEQNAELRQFLLGTKGRVLVEASPVDRIWGIGLAQDDDRAGNPTLWRGLNLLGFALMRVRERLG
ncbi:DUF1768 domain-containing protein [Chromobacterium phragmitis]|uniref:DUF1768 domain-containing protein n=1 Tax=Chromobacterium phragmitis TaxID=2202141 RepID=A0A344UL53_9NEIS|nr:NADAR family protein [Chromobacterium phragmitis]AXE30632.1 DUF1768 domain-containing protein [Chromobacterium phragmitis]AXE36001.1 DUF1768 domain-containing protein [Chromobacterium phragmitis]